ncbi:MAG: hypothetical protein IJF94_02885 [Eubacterium sp.]|nr:hypothetical protein [Eubacterium sp.]
MKNCKRVTFTMIMVLLLLPLLSAKVEGGTKKQKVDTDKYLFACPGNGWSTITVNVDYTEYIVKHDGKNKYWKRDIFYAHKSAYAMNKPKLTMNLKTTKHINSDGKTLHTFKNWTKQSVLADPTKWDYFALYKNGTNRYYKYTTKNKGVTSYNVYCKGAAVPTKGKTIKLKLNTK